MDQIHLNHLSPLVQDGLFGQSSDVWNTDVLLSKGKYYLLRSGSGKGKTSAISFIYGLRRDYSGTISFDQISANTLSFQSWSNIRRSSLSMVPQDLRLFRQLTALDNVLLKTAIHPSELSRSVEDMFTAFGMEKLMHKRCDKLSFGEQQRVAIIRALVQPFDFLLMDEPFSHLDKENISRGLSLITEACRKRNAGLVLTSLGEDYGVDFHQIMEV